MTTESFIFFNSWLTPLDRMTDEEQLEYLKAIVTYGLGGERPVLSARIDFVFDLVADDIDNARKKYEAICEKRRIAGRKGGTKSSKCEQEEQEEPIESNCYQMQANEAIDTKCKHNKNKNKNKNKDKNDNKEKYIKRKYGECELVELTDDEFLHLCDRVGETNVSAVIQILDNYKASSGKKYKNDYRAILTWVIDKFNEGNNGHTTGNHGNAFAVINRIAAEEQTGSGIDSKVWG